MENLIDHLHDYWLTDHQAKIFVYLYQYWPKPASTVAKVIGTERTNSYKAIQVLVAQWLIAETHIKHIKQFYVPDKHVLRQLIDKQKKAIVDSEKTVEKIEQELHILDQQHDHYIPSIRIFEWKSGMQQFFHHMQEYMMTHHYGVMTRCASYTLDVQSLATHHMDDYMGDFLQRCQEMHISIDMRLGTWILLMEQFTKSMDIWLIPRLPADREAVSLIIAGDTICLLLFGSVPFALTIKSDPFAQMFHVLLW